jgi:hypothetical protein
VIRLAIGVLREGLKRLGKEFEGPSNVNNRMSGAVRIIDYQVVVHGAHDTLVLAEDFFSPIARSVHARTLYDGLGTIFAANDQVVILVEGAAALHGAHLLPSVDECYQLRTHNNSAFVWVQFVDNSNVLVRIKVWLIDHLDGLEKTAVKVANPRTIDKSAPSAVSYNALLRLPQHK